MLRVCGSTYERCYRKPGFRLSVHPPAQRNFLGNLKRTLNIGKNHVELLNWNTFFATEEPFNGFQVHLNSRQGFRNAEDDLDEIAGYTDRLDPTKSSSCVVRSLHVFMKF